MVIGDVFHGGYGNVCLLRKRYFHIIRIDKGFTLAIGDNGWNVFLKLQVCSIKNKFQLTRVLHRESTKSRLKHFQIRDVRNRAHVKNTNLVAHRLNLWCIELPKRVIQEIGQNKDVCVVFSEPISQVGRGYSERFSLNHAKQNRNLGFGVV